MNIQRKELEHALFCKGSKLRLDTSAPRTPIFSPDGNIESYKTNDRFVKVTCETCSDIKKKYEIE